MKRLPVFLALSLALLSLTTSAHAAPVPPAPIWNINAHHTQTNFPPGDTSGTAEYWVDVKNVGNAPTSGPITLTVQLPAGLTLNRISSLFYDSSFSKWSCPGALAGDTTIVCTRLDGLLPHQGDQNSLLGSGGGIVNTSLVVVTDVDPGANGDLSMTATVSGGGAAQPASTTEVTHISPEPAPFGIVPGSFYADFLNFDGLTPVRQAGAHPYQARFAFDFNSIPRPYPDRPLERTGATEGVRDLRIDLPPGFLGDPTAVAECTPVALLGENCPRPSQVGYVNLLLFPVSETRFQSFQVPIFNMVHPRGSITDLAFTVAGNPVHIQASLDPASNYSITTTTSNINETLIPFTSDVVIWGVPKDSTHDYERCEKTQGNIEIDAPCPSDGPDKAFLTVPSQCDAGVAMKFVHYDSWQNTGVFGPDVTYELPGHFTGCDAPRFDPTVSIRPTGQQANTPTGLDVSIEVPQISNPNALMVPPVKSTVVTLPQGMTLSPSFADGLDGCTEAQIGLGTNDPVACPDNSRIGEVTLKTPLLPKALEGSMYLAKQNANPFGSTFGMYMAIHDTEERGALVKISGKIELDPVTGQVTTSFDHLPEFPFEDFTLKFRSGDRAPLVNPPDCGSHTIAVKVASYAQPSDPVDASNDYDVTQGPGGGPCPPDSAHRPFAPNMEAGTLNPAAGSFSPFLFRISRGDSDQELSQLKVVPPPGLLAKIAGIPFCSEAAIAAIPSAEGTGRQEFDHPHCPVASQIGTVSVGVGSGSGPNYFPGKVYLAGPYKGAPLSLVVVIPALAGPFDLGNSVVRTALQVDPETTRVTAVSDPFPTIIHGELLRVRDVRLRLDRPNTMLNPTNCSPFSVDADVTGIGGDLLSTADDFLTHVSNPFQVGDCGALGFGPKLTFRLKGGTHRGDHPAFFSRLTARPGDANIGHAIVALPHSEFLENAHIKTICTRVQFAADNCPAESIYGHAKAITPLLDQPVEGPLYLRSSNHVLPDLVAKLRGQINANLVGHIDSVNGGIRTSFDSVPDVPVTEFTLTMRGGAKGLLVNSRNLCKAPSRADVRFTAQSGKALHIRPLVQNGCKKSARKQKRAHR